MAIRYSQVRSEARPSNPARPCQAGEQRVLQGVLGVLQGPEHPVAVHLQLAAVRLGQLPERVAVAGPRPRSQVGGQRIPAVTVARTDTGGELGASPGDQCLTTVDGDGRGTTMMLKDKVAVIYGAGGAIGGAVARAFARGSQVFLTGRLRRRSRRSPGDRRRGGSAEAAEVDALDERAVDGHLQSVIDRAGRVDISFNAIGIPDATILGVPLVELDVEQFALPITAYTTSYFLTARAGRPADDPAAVGRDHDGHRAARADRHPAGGRLRPGDGRQGGAHPGPLRRARAARRPRGRPAAAGHAGDAHDQGRVRAARRGVGHDLGAVAGARSPAGPTRDG